MPHIEHLCDQLAAFAPPDTAREVHEALSALLRLRNMVDHHAAVLAGAVERLGLAKKQGRTTRELLIVMGAVPAVATRLLRIGVALAGTPRLAGHTADGSVSGEHADAIARGLSHIGVRAREPLSESQRQTCVTDLLAQAFSGATPADIDRRARTLGNRVADDAPAAVPARDDRDINTFDVTTDGDGRVVVRGDVDAVIGEKLHTMIDALAAPRPEPDGSPDARSPGRRRSEALERILDAAAHGDDGLVGMPKHQVLLTLPADNPDLASMAFTGPVTLDTARLLTCDATVTGITVDKDGVPVAMTDNLRLFPPHLRRALIVRDGGCCIKCGAPASWAHAHHIRHHADGGRTVLDNGCLLCPSCHTDVHHNGWDVVLGADRHPWLVPPASVDPERRPLPAYNRRTMRLDNAA
uniref:HNH endonuclease n=1 Tax=Gordonia sp. B7-2 TaxID=3420932 RepID=UPI003D943ADD